MDRFDVHPSFKQVRYLPNRNLLKDIVDQTRIYVGQPESIDMRSERQMYLDCTTITDCDCYQKLFPHGKYEKEVQDKKQSIRFKTCKTLKDCDDLQRDYPHRKIEIDALREKIIYEDCHTLSKCEIYLKKYPNGKYKSQVEKKIDDLIKRELDKCESIDQYESFINFYSNSKYVDEAQERIDELIRSRRRKMIRNTIIWILVSLVIAGIIGFMYWDSNRKIEIAEQRAKQAEYNLYDNIVNKGDSLSCSRFIDSYPNSEYVGEVMKVLEDYNYHHLSSLDDCLDFVSKYPRSKYMQSVDSLINERAETLKKALLTNKDDYDLDAMWDLINKYGSSDKESIRSVVADVSKRFNQIKEEQKIKAEKAREDSIRKEEEAKKRAEYEKYGTDANAWKTATSAHTITAYQDYLTRYPRGKHVETANKYIIDLEVQKVINSGDYGHLPSSQKMSYETGRYSTIHISSRCDRTITIMYSGVKSMKIVLGSYQSRTIVLPSSTYKVVATASGVRSFYGTENLTGGDYESEYYISTTRY